MNKKKIITTCIATVMLITSSLPAANAEWLSDNNGWWYRSDNGYCIGWNYIDNGWYFFDQSGYMKTGWVTSGDKRYYLGGDGKMLFGNSYIIDNKVCSFDMSGAYIDNTNNSISSITTDTNNNTLTVQEFNNAVCDKMHELVNEHRRNNGVKELNRGQEIDKSAYLKSKDMVDRNYFSHDYNGENCFDLVKRLSGEKVYGENIVMYYPFDGNYTTEGAENVANKLFTIWKNSPGHNANMLRESFKSMGFGFAIKDSNKGVYATQHFKN